MGILPDAPSPQPPSAPGAWLRFKLPKLKRSGRPRKLYLFPKALLYQIRNGGTLEAAYRALATERAPDPDCLDTEDYREFDKALDRHESAVSSVKRQVARERKWAKKIECLEQAKKRGGVLGK